MAPHVHANSSRLVSSRVPETCGRRHTGSCPAVRRGRVDTAQAPVRFDSLPAKRSPSVRVSHRDRTGQTRRIGMVNPLVLSVYPSPSPGPRTASHLMWGRQGVRFTPKGTSHARWFACRGGASMTGQCPSPVVAVHRSRQLPECSVESTQWPPRQTTRGCAWRAQPEQSGTANPRRTVHYDMLPGSRPRDGFLDAQLQVCFGGGTKSGMGR